MPLVKPKTPKIKSLHEVGRYAVGVHWMDGHESIYPLDDLRRNCPCEACRGDSRSAPPEGAFKLKQFSRLGEQAVFIGWGDGHETLYTMGQLRGICRCAYCIAEPERPITGR